METDEATEENDDSNLSEYLKKLSHKQRKALLKKEKRKLRRQAIAKERDAEKIKEEEARKHSPSYEVQLQQIEYEEQAELLQIADESKRQHELWLWHEELFAEKLKRKKEQEERERLQKIEIERKIKEEWEERQRKEKEEEEEKRKKKEKQEELLRQAREAENKCHEDEDRAGISYAYSLDPDETLSNSESHQDPNWDGEWHNPLAPVHYGQERQIEACPFFAKVGACRFGDRCSRGHPLPESGRILMFASMFRHFQLDQGLCEEYDTDIVLEYEDSEVYQKFREFYEDTLPEFKASGQVTQFKVCCNYQPHLRGNVYVSYDREDEAMQTFAMFNARWYGGKQLTAQFVNIPSWRRAICGLFAKGRCPKGKECNFLHVFKNPSSEFNLADRDMESFTPQRNTDRRRNGRRSRSRDRIRQHSRSPSSRRYRHSRSRSRDRHRSYRSYSRRSRSRSKERYTRSRSKDRKFKSDRYRSRSPNNGLDSYRRRDRKTRSSYSRSRSKSRERSKKKKKQKKREGSVEEVWVEKTVENESSNNAAYKSRSSSRERSVSRSSSVASERKRHKKKKYRHSKD